MFLELVCISKMIIRKAFKYKLKTKDANRRNFEKFSSYVGFVWNMFLRLNLDRLHNGHHVMWYREMAFWLTLWKKSIECSWLKECHSQVLQQVLMDLDRAFRDAFDKNQPGKRLPVFRKKIFHKSFRYVQGFKIDNRRVYLPKIGWIGFFKSREIEGRAKNITVSEEIDCWYIAIQVEMEADTTVHPSGSSVGIDLGITKLATLSDGTAYKPLNSYRRNESKVTYKQRKCAKKKKGSNNRKRSQKELRKVHRKILNARMDYLHKITDGISKSHANMYIEGLKSSCMSASARGTIDNPGSNVRAKSGLNKSILDQGWREFRRQLTYKASWRGGQVVAVDPKYTSQICSCCGYKNAKNRRSQARFVCLDCGFTCNADVNAARNILKRGQNKVLAAGQAVSVCGEMALAASMKQKPVRNREKVSSFF